MAYEQKPGQGSLWNNDKKQKDTAPDLTGTVILPDGTEAFIDGWYKTTQTGKEFISISIKAKNKQRSTEEPQRAPSSQQLRRPAPTQQTRQQPPNQTRQQPAWPEENEQNYEP